LFYLLTIQGVPINHINQKVQAGRCKNKRGSTEARWSQKAAFAGVKLSVSSAGGGGDGTKGGRQLGGTEKKECLEPKMSTKNSSPNVDGVGGL